MPARPSMVETPNATADVVLIKRYANRRFYNTVSLTYMALDDLAGMVLRHQRFVVRDAASGEDITQEILDRLH
jgi:polyhydroxyalkanoate synthesis regulator protein